MLRLALLLPLVACEPAPPTPTMPDAYAAVILMRMPYIGLEMPLRVLTSKSVQKIEYYDGLEIDEHSAKGTYKYVFNNGKRDCRFSPPPGGPTAAGRAAAGDAWKPMAFFPDLSGYTWAGQELVGGKMCDKFTLDVSHGETGTMNDHISFYWDPVLEKPVRWHMHSRHITFGSHTDEYIMDVVSLQTGAPNAEDFALPPICGNPTQAYVSIQMSSFLAAAHAMHAPTGDEASKLLFSTFLKQYGKSYAPEEHAERHAIFERNVRLVQDLNHQHAGKTRFKGNQFLDMTKEEVLRFRGGKRRGSSLESRRSPEHLKYVRTHIVNNSTARPRAFDWRTARPGVVGPVKDQAACGSCWTYGVIGPVESFQAIHSSDGQLVELPEQFVVDCTWTNGTGMSGGNFGCDGGDSDIGALEIIRKYGGIIPSAKAYGSYLSVNGYCKDTRLMEVGAKITHWTDIEKRQEEHLLDAIAAQGPVNVNIIVPQEMLYYESGVLDVEGCKHNESEIDHSVIAVGYGTDEHGTDYYTIRNSWSTYWGDQGYVKVARGDRDCSASDYAGYPTLASSAFQASIVV